MNDSQGRTVTNTSFSKALPTLQLAIDSTSLGEFKVCPRRYFYRIIEGWVPRRESVHLIFGILLHSGCERYHLARAAGKNHNAALESALAWVLLATWNSELKRPWLSDDPNKNRLTLIRTLVWYLDECCAEDALETVVMENGRAAVELSFRFDSGLVTTTTGEPWVFCGHLDRIARLNGEPYIVDLKSTKGALSPTFFSQFTPDNQMSMYTLAGRISFHQPIRALIIDGAQILATISRFQRGLVSRDDAQVEEWYKGTAIWLHQMEGHATGGQTAEAWPQNDKSCHHYGGCPYREVCARTPGARDQWLNANYTKRVWDPLVVRGDI